MDFDIRQRHAELKKGVGKKTDERQEGKLPHKGKSGSVRVSSF